MEEGGRRGKVNAGGGMKCDEECEEGGDDDGNDKDNYDDGNDASDDERIESNEDKNHNLNQNNDDKEEEYEEEYVCTPESYESTDDENEHMNEEEYDCIDEELYKDVNVTQEKTYNQVKDDAHVTLTPVYDTQKTKVPLQSSSVSSDFATQFLNLDNVPPADNEIISMMNVDVHHEEPSNQTSILLTIPITKAQAVRKRYIDLEKSVKDIINDEVKSQLPQILPKAVSDFATPVIKSTVTESLKDAYGKSVSLKRDHEDKDKDEDPIVVSDRGMKRWKTSKDVESSKVEEQIHIVDDAKVQQNQRQDMGNTDDQPNVEAAPKHDYKIAKAEKPPLSFDELMSTPIDFSAYVMNDLKIDNMTQEHLNNPEGKEYLFDLSKPLPLIMDRGRQVVPADYFINNDLEYLKGGSSSKKYTTSTTKTNAAKYDIQGIEDMVPSLWSPVKVAYDRYAVWGISHWGPKRQRFYGFASNMVSKHDVYSTKRIIAVTKVKVMKWYDYGYLEKIEVRREDQQLYKFKEGDFPGLHLHDIEDMLLLLV
ncbi:hypothetical protein Tco_0696798 [Tanacetum coccineum]